MKPVAGEQAVAVCLNRYRVSARPDRATEKQAVKHLLDRLAQQAPGRSVEVRVPPYAAVQVVAGTSHRRGTPPACVECDARTFIQLATGAMSWGQALAAGTLLASGERSDLSGYFPLIRE